MVTITGTLTDRFSFLKPTPKSNDVWGANDPVSYIPSSIIDTPIDDGISVSRRIFIS